MFLESQLGNSEFCRNSSGLNKKGKTTSSELKSQFVKTNKKSIQNCVGHSQITNNNSSRHTSVASISSSTWSTQTATKNNSIIKNNCNNNRCMHLQRSWSMPHSKNFNEACNVSTQKKIINYQFTEQRCNYERMSQQQLQQHQQWPGSSEQVIRCIGSNSRISTCSADTNRALQDIKNMNYAKLMALNEFRIQNSRDCFSDLHETAQNTSNRTTKSSEKIPNTKVSSKTESDKLNCSLTDINKSKSQQSIFLSSSPVLLTPMPYALRQRILRNQLPKDTTNRKSTTTGLTKSNALSFFL